MKRMLGIAAAVVMGLACAGQAMGAAEIEGWGDFRGIRVAGELHAFQTSLRVVAADGKSMAFTATEEVKNPKWARQGDTQTSSGTILFENGSTVSFVTTVQELAGDSTKVGEESAKVMVAVTADEDLTLQGVYYHINLPAGDYPDEAKVAEPQTVKTTGFRLTDPRRTIEIGTEEKVDFVLQRDTVIDTDIVSQLGLRLPRDSAADQLVAIVFPIATGNMTKGQTVKASFTIKVGGQTDTAPVTLAVDTSKPGSPFAGIGGNFRVYGGEDQASVDYNLANLRVPWGRVAMLLNAFEPREGMDPVEAMKAGGAGGRQTGQIKQSMETAKLLASKGIPLILTTWDMPGWALLPPGPQTPGRPFAIPARRLRQDKAAEVYDEIVTYLKYLKSDYGVEPALVSINESDLGIDVMQTPEEHAEFIREVGRRMAAAGLKTKMLLADACSPHPVKFVDAAMRDPEAVKYIGAVSFHSWHDGTDAEFRAWGDAARKLNVPLFCGEGGTDSDSYRYPAIFQEPWYAMYELDTYMRICREAQPLSILHWQMTANYSLLVGGGRSGQPLAPGRRFWQVKQLDLAPDGAAAVPVKTESPNVTACGFLKQGRVVVDLLNNGAAREATVTGLPAGATSAHVYVTDGDRGMKELDAASVSNGTAHISLPMDSLVTIDTGS